MSARGWLGGYLAAVVAVTFIHVPAVLAALLLFAVTAAGTQRWRLLRRTLWAVVAFNLVVSLGYALVAGIRGDFDAGYLLLVNLRVVLLVFLGFWFVARIDPLAALAGLPTATLIATLALGQIRTLARLLADFRLAFASRNPLPPRLSDRARHTAAQAVALMDKTVAATTESAMALRSRGAFDD